MNNDLTPKVLKIERQTGIAGQYGYVATVDYGTEQDGVSEVQFVGNDDSERVYMVIPATQVLVDRSDLDGVRLTPDYVRRFFS